MDFWKTKKASEPPSPSPSFWKIMLRSLQRNFSDWSDTLFQKFIAFPPQNYCKNLQHFLKLNWCDSGWWRYQLNTILTDNEALSSGEPKPIISNISMTGRRQWGFIKWWAEANNFQCCPRAEGPRATLEIIGWGSPLDKFIVKLQSLSTGRRQWKISPARQYRLFSWRRSC